ncbi:hypothetical protein [Nocardia salmonicida]|uniref:hypothetical protein n=1 Tax=Nocardia salmonicida TaxID=53431 RepID=UPI002E28B624|nr:hypothetical protein [Nocardia salmonicida]
MRADIELRPNLAQEMGEHPDDPVHLRHDEHRPPLESERCSARPQVIEQCLPDAEQSLVPLAGLSVTTG